MKKDKKQKREALAEALCEIAIILPSFGIGVLVIFLLDAEADLLSMDFEGIVLIGIAVLGALFVAVYALVRLLKKIIKANRK